MNAPPGHRQVLLSTTSGGCNEFRLLHRMHASTLQIIAMRGVFIFHNSIMNHTGPVSCMCIERRRTRFPPVFVLTAQRWSRASSALVMSLVSGVTHSMVETRLMSGNGTAARPVSCSDGIEKHWSFLTYSQLHIGISALLCSNLATEYNLQYVPIRSILVAFMYFVGLIFCKHTTQYLCRRSQYYLHAFSTAFISSEILFKSALRELIQLSFQSQLYQFSQSNPTNSTTGDVSLCRRKKRDNTA